MKGGDDMAIIRRGWDGHIDQEGTGSEYMMAMAGQKSLKSLTNKSTVKTDLQVSSAMHQQEERN